MPLRRIGEKSYFYQSSRVGGRVTNKLVARGELAESLAIASRIEAERRSESAREQRRRRAAGRRWRAERAGLNDQERPIVELVRCALGLADRALESAGYHKRRGEWRRAKMTDKLLGRQAEVVGPEKLELILEDGKPKAVVRKLTSPDEIREAHTEHLLAAWSFDRNELPRVRTSFRQAERHDALVADGRIEGPPLLPDLIEAYGGDPLGRAEQALIHKLALGTRVGLYAEEALKKTLAALKAELSGPNPSAVEKVLVGSAGLAWLDSMLAEEQAAKASTGGSIELLEYLDRRKTRAAKRLQSVLRTLETVRRKATPRVAVQVNLGGPGALSPAGDPGAIEGTTERHD